MFDETWAFSSTKITWEKFSDSPVGNPVLAVQKNERWYILLPAKRKKLLQALEKFVPEAKKLLEESFSASELADKMKPLRAYFDDFHDN